MGYNAGISHNHAFHLRLLSYDQDLDTAKERSMGLANALNCDTSSQSTITKCLMGKDAKDITYKQWSAIPASQSSYFTLPFAPVVDGVFLKDTPGNLIKLGEVRCWFVYSITYLYHDHTRVTKIKLLI